MMWFNMYSYVCNYIWYDYVIYVGKSLRRCSARVFVLACFYVSCFFLHTCVYIYICIHLNVRKQQNQASTDGNSGPAHCIKIRCMLLGHGYLTHATCSMLAFFSLSCAEIADVWMLCFSKRAPICAIHFSYVWVGWQPAEASTFKKLLGGGS